MTTETHNPTQAAEDSGQERVLATLAALGQATANEIADRAGLGYSTVTARLRKLAEAGTVHKQPAGTGPTSWRLADPAAGPDNQPEPEDEPEEAEPDQAESTVNEVDEAEPDEAEHDEAEHDEAEHDEAEHDRTTPREVEPGTDRDTAAPPPPSAVDATGEDAGGDEETQEPTTAPAPPEAEPASTPGARRPPGKLREQVLGVLQDRPDETLTPHQISKLLDGASSGAIVLACRKLVGEGSAKQVRERPATFQARVRPASRTT